MAKDTYRYLLRIPEDMRRALVEAAQREGRSFNAEVTRRLEHSLAARAANPARDITPLER